jgi:hypothetical protein
VPHVPWAVILCAPAPVTTIGTLLVPPGVGGGENPVRFVPSRSTYQASAGLKLEVKVTTACVGAGSSGWLRYQRKRGKFGCRP